ncbi:hypothetical protein PIB30_027515 [Stylosanthes scabra]|uniref:Uncharacterized protein n=1 Tax=Stylosanthes scabra TaxID=79078 RepID=A0ABU6SAW4_9FABA|nr:hypothetical protein [Stylosanthes scabra]
MEKRGRMVGVRIEKKKKSGSGRKAVIQKLRRYLQCDSFMYAPIVSPLPSQPSLPLFPSSAKVVELKKPRKEKHLRFVDQLVEYLKSDVYMYAPLLHSSPGTLQQCGKITVDASGSPARLTNGNVKHRPEIHVPETHLSEHHHTETVKHTVYQISRPLSASRLKIMGMNNRRRGGGRKKRAKLSWPKKNNGNATGNKTSSCLRKKLGELQRSVPGSHGMKDMNAFYKSIENYILVLEAKVTVLRCLSNFYGV